MPDLTERSSSVVVLDHEPTWAHAFDAIAAELQLHIGHAVVAIDHIGSTAVPGLAARPVIDVLMRVVELRHIDAAFDAAMAEAGFASPGPATSDHRRFYVHTAGFRGLHAHVYLCPLWQRAAGDHLRFRDYLRGNPSQAGRYGLLKRQLAAAYPHDFETYVSGKADLMHRLLGQARGYYSAC